MKNFPITIFLLSLFTSLQAQNYKSFHDDKGNYGYKNEQQVIVIQPKYDYASDFSENRGIVILGKKCGAVDSAGNEVIPIKYDIANGGFHDGLCGFNMNGKWGFLNINGDEIISFKYSYVKDFSEGIAYVSEDYDKKFFIDKKGNNLFPVHQYLETKDCNEGLIIAKKDDKWGCLDKTGKVVIPFLYSDILVRKGEIINVKRDRKWGGIDSTYTLIIPIEYDNAMSFREGLAAVKQNEKWGFIDKTAKIIIPIQYDAWVASFKNGFATMEMNGEKFEIDKTGKRKGAAAIVTKTNPLPAKKPANTFPLTDTAFSTKGIVFGFPKGYKPSKYNNENSMTFYKADSSILISVSNTSGSIAEIVADWDPKSISLNVEGWYKNVGQIAKKTYDHPKPVYLTDYLYPSTFGGGDFIWIQLKTTVKSTGLKELEAVKKSIALKPIPLITREIIPGTFTMGVPAYLKPATGDLYGHKSIFTDGYNFLYFKSESNKDETNPNFAMIKFKEFIIIRGFKLLGNFFYTGPSEIEFSGFYGLEADALHPSEKTYEAYAFFKDPEEGKDIWILHYRLGKGTPKNFEADIKTLLKTIKIKNN